MGRLRGGAHLSADSGVPRDLLPVRIVFPDPETPHGASLHWERTGDCDFGRGPEALTPIPEIRSSPLSLPMAHRIFQLPTEFKLASQNSPAFSRILRRFLESSGASQNFPASRRTFPSFPELCSRSQNSPAAPRIFQRATESYGGFRNLPTSPRIFQRFAEDSVSRYKIPERAGRFREPL